MSKTTKLGRMVKSIKVDRLHGSRWLVKEAVKALRFYGKIADMYSPHLAINRFETLCDALADARPNMAAIGNTVFYVYSQVHRRLKEKPGSKLSSLIEEETTEILARMDDDIRRITFLAERLVRSKRVFTYSYSSTVAEALRGANPKMVTVTECRPLYEGKALAKELAKRRIPVTLVIDASAGLFIPSADLVLVGADSVLANGSIVNKTGTCTAALISKVYRIPFYVLCETSKFNPAIDAESFTSEEGPISEVAKLRGVSVRNVYFDVTPPDLVTAIVTEKGEMTSSMVKKEMARLRELRSR